MGKIGLTKNHQKIRRLTMEFSTKALKPLAEELAEIIEKELEKEKVGQCKG